MYVLSSRIKAFPLGRPRSQGSEDITSRIFYEQTVSNLIKQLINTKGFIIKCPKTITTSGNLSSELEFNLGGYWFNISSGTNIFPLENNVLVYEKVDIKEDEPGTSITSANPCYIYACIKLTSTVPYEISGQDELYKSQNVYRGLRFIASSKSPENFKDYEYFLPIFSGQTNNSGTPIGTWNVYQDSYIKFDSTSINITGIDGKHN